METMEALLRKEALQEVSFKGLFELAKERVLFDDDGDGDAENFTFGPRHVICII